MQIIGSVNPHDFRGIDENGKDVIETVIGEDVVALTDGQIQSALAGQFDLTELAIRVNNSATSNNWGLTCASLKPDHQFMPSIEFNKDTQHFIDLKIGREFIPSS